MMNDKIQKRALRNEIEKAERVNKKMEVTLSRSGDRNHFIT